MKQDAVLAPVSWPRMIRAVEKVRERLLRAARALDGAGGNAVAAWVSRVDEAAVRNEPTIEILVRRSDLADTTNTLSGAGFIQRNECVFLDGSNSSARDAVHIVFACERVREDSPQPSPDVTESEAAEHFRLLTLDALIRMKLTAFRDKDRTHLRDLIDVGLLDQSASDRLPPELRARLQQLFDNPEG